VFNGDGYSESWPIEAARLGLPNFKTTPEALEALTTEKNLKLLASLNVLTAAEAKARQFILFEYYTKAINIEANSTYNIAKTIILPAVFKYQKSVAESVAAATAVLGDKATVGQKALLVDVTERIETLLCNLKALESIHHEVHSLKDDVKAEAYAYNTKVIPAMKEVRVAADALENIVDDDLWPLPKYSEILFLR